jgi:hypothetical protein
MSRRNKRRRKLVAAMPIASVDFMGIILAIAPDEGWLNLVQIHPDGSAESLAELERPGMSPEQCLVMMHEAVETAFHLVKEQQEFNRFRRHDTGPLECPFDDVDPPYTAFGPHENN